MIVIQCHVQYCESEASHDRITIRCISRGDSCQNDSIGLAESPASLIPVDEPASLMDVEFRGVGMEARPRRERRGRVGTAEAAGLVGEALDASSTDSLVADGELKAPSLGRRILSVGVASGLGPGGAG